MKYIPRRSMTYTPEEKEFYNAEQRMARIVTNEDWVAQMKRMCGTKAQVCEDQVNLYNENKELYIKMIAGNVSKRMKILFDKINIQRDNA